MLNGRRLTHDDRPRQFAQVGRPRPPTLGLDQTANDLRIAFDGVGVPIRKMIDADDHFVLLGGSDLRDRRRVAFGFSQTGEHRRNLFMHGVGLLDHQYDRIVQGADRARARVAARAIGRNRRRDQLGQAGEIQIGRRVAWLGIEQVADRIDAQANRRGRVRIANDQRFVAYRGAQILRAQHPLEGKLQRHLPGRECHRLGKRGFDRLGILEIDADRDPLFAESSDHGR